MIDFLLGEPGAIVLMLVACISLVLGVIYRFLIWIPPISMQNEIFIEGLRFVEIGPESPEQYEVYIGDRIVGYVRYRFGYLSADYPDAGMNEVFGRELKRQTGQMTNQERGRWLPVIARRLNQCIQRDGLT